MTTPDAINNVLDMLAGILGEDKDETSVLDLHIMFHDVEAGGAAADYIRSVRASEWEPSAAADAALERVIARLKVPVADGGPGLIAPA